MVLTVFLGTLGIFLLAMGARFAVRGSVSLAKGLGVSTYAIGFTALAIGTSLPEFVVGAIAATDGHGDLVLGNIVGSNMANMGLALAIAAIIRPIKMTRDQSLADFSATIVAAAGLYLLARDGLLSRVDGLLLLGGGVLYGGRMLKRKVPASRVQTLIADGSPLRERANQLLELLAGAGLLWVGASLLVRSAEDVARDFGISEVLIGITVLAIGTSLPEIATTVLASRTKTIHLAVGNILGSNIMNVCVILGCTVLIAPIATRPPLWRFDLPVLVAATVIMYALFYTGRLLSRREGFALLGGYASYLLATILQRG